MDHGGDWNGQFGRAQFEDVQPAGMTSRTLRPTLEGADDEGATSEDGEVTTGGLHPDEGARSDDPDIASVPHRDDRGGGFADWDLKDFIGPISSRWDSSPYDRGHLASEHLETAETLVRFRIEGWLAQRGPSVWFGAGSTGKTQLLLWMAALLATRPEDRRNHEWLGGRVNGTGHVLILTAEDSREQIVGRIRDIISRTLEQDEEALRRTCARLHVIPFLSLAEEVFEHDSPSLFEAQGKERVWRSSAVLREIRRYIEAWNVRHEDPEDRIIGVVMDSATSMAGFDSLDALATTNFFFYLGRMCERLDIFWTIIGHTPKSAPVPKTNARGTAASRLRGVAMWTTAPRMTVEVRHVQEWGSGLKLVKEARELRERLPGYRKEDILVVCVAKANLLGAHREERYLVRSKRGAFIDVTERDHELPADQRPPAAVMIAFEARTPDESEAIGGCPADRAGGRPRSRRAATVRTDYGPGTDLVIELMRSAYPSIGTGGRVSANRVIKELRVWSSRSVVPGARLVTTASGGRATPARIGSINWHMDQLVTRDLLQVAERSSKRVYLLTDRGRDLLRTEEQIL